MQVDEKSTLTEIRASEVAGVAAFLPDTPWTTTAVHACERRVARVWVDSTDAPGCAAVLAPGIPDHDVAPRLYLFASNQPADPLVAFATAFPRPVHVVCDEAVGDLLDAAAPEVSRVADSVHWFERLDTVERATGDGTRRLRLGDAEAVERLGLRGLLRTFESIKDLLMVGGACGVTDGDELACAAFTVDMSVNYARIVVFTQEPYRGRGLATAVTRRLVSAHHEQGRLACTIVEDRDAAGEALCARVGFEAAGRVSRRIL